jgi:hypothetical protein
MQGNAQVGMVSGTIPALGSHEYMVTQRRLIQGKENVDFTRLAIFNREGMWREPSMEECARHWLETGAHEEFRRVWICKERAQQLMQQVGVMGQLE